MPKVALPKPRTSAPLTNRITAKTFLTKSGTGHLLLYTLVMFSFFIVLPKAESQTAKVSLLGASSSWYSDDTRNSSGTDLVGSTRTLYGKPGQPPTPADDIAIGQQLQFVGGPSGSTGGGTVKIIAPTGNSAKSTLSTVNLAGFAPASDLTGGSFAAEYRWYMEPNPTNRTVAFRLGIQSTQWAASQSSFTAIRSGEQTWDLVLVNLMASPTPNDWNLVNVDKDNGLWYLYGQAGNGNWVGIAGSAPPGGSMQKTLADWALDATWGPILFGAGAKVTNIQFGLGSGQQQCNAYVDYLTTSILNSGNPVNFTAPVRVYTDATETTLVGGYTSIQAAVSDATTLNGHFVRVDPGTYVEQINLNKSLTIDGGDKTTTTIQGDITFPLLGGGRYFILISGAGAGSTIKNISFNKTDKTGVQNLIGLQAANVTFDDCNFTGQYVLGDPDVSRAFEVSGSGTNFLIQDCSITNLRQPAYFNPGSSGAVSGTYVHNTRGWVVDGGTVTFSGNTFGTNAVDIALLAGTAFGAPYDPLSTLSANNDNAIFSDQRVYVAYNVTQNTLHGTIQAAVNAAMAGDVIQVSDGTYTENVNVDKALTLNGANAGLACGSRGTESIIAPASGVPITVTADGVTINGFEITAPSSPNAISFPYRSNVTLKYNKIHTIGTTVTGQVVHALYYEVGSGSYSNIEISDNCLDNISSTLLTGWSASAIGILHSGSTGVLTGLKIDRNTINDVQVNTGDWPTGKIAYGIIINVGGGGTYLTTTGKVVDAKIRHNEISNVSGFIATGIAMEGNTENALVQNNIVSTLFGRKVAVRSGGGYDLNALKFENNRYVATCTVENNSFRTNTFTHDVTLGRGYAVANYVPIGQSYTGGTTGPASLSCNWFGTANYDLIKDLPSLDGKILNKAGCATNFLLFLTDGTDSAPETLGFQPASMVCTGGCPNGGLVTNTSTNVTYCSIQSAIDDPLTTNGHIITVAAGTYAENITVNKSLDIRGPKYNVAGNDGSRGSGEAIVVPGVSAAGGEIFMVKTSNVSINGFTIDGDNTLLASGWIGTNGADVNAAEGVTIYDATPVVNNLTVSNNIIQNLGYFGVTLFGASNYSDANTSKTGHVIENNLIRDMGYYNTGNGFDSWGGGVLLYNSHYARVEDNVMTNVRIGIQTGNFQTTHVGDPQYQVIDNNSIQTRYSGIFFNLHNFSPWTVSNNTITGLDNAVQAGLTTRPWRGMLIASLGNNMGSSTFSNNTIDGSGITLFPTGKEGINVWNVQNNASANITGGSISGVTNGIFLNNYEGYASDAGAGAHATISGVSISASSSGIRVLDSPSSTSHANVQATVTNCFITGGTDGVKLEEAVASKVTGTVNNNSITGQSGKAINATTIANTVAATCNWYGSTDANVVDGKVLGNATFLPFLTNGTDDAPATAGFQPVAGTCNGVVTEFYVNDNNQTGDVYTTAVGNDANPGTPSRPKATIGAAITAAATGNTIKVDVGTYNEDVNINKDLTLTGAGIDQSTVVGQIGGDGATMRVASPGVVIDGFTITRAGNNTTDWNNSGLNSAGIAIQGHANDAEIKNCKMIGNRTGIDINDSDGNNIHNNIITFNRTGLIFRNKTDNTNLTENEITDNWTIGVLFLDASSGSNSPVQSALNSTFNNNKISGNWYGDIQDRQSGGSLPAPGTTNMKNFECNWYSTTSPVVNNANSAEPGYSAQIPVLYGGAAVPPGGQPNILGTAAANLDYIPYLVNGTDNQLMTPGFQPLSGVCAGGPVQVYNGNTLVSGHALIQEAIDAVTTLNGYTVRIVAGTYTENVDAATGGKNLIFAPGSSPGCVNIVGDFTLNAGDVLEMEIDAATACTGYDQFTVSGTVTLGGATLTIPAGAYFPVSGDEIKIIDGSNPIAGIFASGNFVTDGNGYTYYISYAGNDVVLTKCCGALIDIGIYNHTAPTPAGNKLQVKLRPNVDVINGSYSAGIFAIRTLTSNGVTFTNLGSAFGYSQFPLDGFGDPITLTDGLYSYYFFSFASVFTGRNWLAGQDTLALTLGYSCVGNATFELVSDAFAIANGAKYYQELGGQNATGIILPTATTATSPVSVSIVATNNGPLCETMPIDLNSTTSNGSPGSPTPYTYVWGGPLAYTNTDANPVPFGPATLGMAGIYTVTVTDGNGCTATGTTNVVVLANGGCVKNVDLTTYYPTITQAINVPETLNGHTLEVPAGNWPENVNVTKALNIKGANFGIPCTGTRVAESIIMGTTAVTIASNGVTIDGFQIEGITGVSSAGYTRDTIRNNKVNALFMGITSSLVVTTPTDGYVIQDNCIDIADQTYDTQGFASNPTLAATQTPGAWYVDRFAPAGFVSASFSGSNRLKHSILQSQTQGDAFYNTQGRKYDIAGSTGMSIELYVPAAWATTGRRMAGFWGTAVNGSNVVTRYPIIEFTSDGANPRFRVWDEGTWIDIGLPTGFAYDQWYTLNIALLSNGAFMCSVGDRSTTISGGGSVSIANVILQGYNHTPGLDYDIYWDNFNAFDNPVVKNAPTVGVALVAAAGSQAVVLQSNRVSDAFYGHLLNYVTTTPRTTVRGGTHTNLMQGVAVVNTIDGVTYSPSTVGVDNVTMTSFGGNYPAIPGANFHAGVYAFTGGANPLDTVNILVDSVTVSNTGKIAPDCAGLSFADFSTGAGNRLRAVVTESFVTNNLNRGVNVRGANALAIFKQDSIGGNGADPYGTGGNDGFGIYAGVGATVILDSNFITNPPTQAGIYPVTAMFIGVAPAAKITAFNNSINRNGNGSLTANTYPIAQFTATCNWWGNGLIDAVDALVDGNVLFVPYLNNGTDNSVARGFQPLGLCSNPKRWYVNDLALTDDVFTLGLGDDLNQGTKRRPFRTIGKAVLTAVTADTVYADAGSYNEQVVVPNTKNNMHIIGVGPCNAVAPALTTMVDFTGTVSGKPTLFDIAGDGTVIDGIHFKADLTKLSSAIIASHSALDNITIKNNCIDPYQSIAGTNLSPYGNRNAISINYGGPTNFRVAAGGVNNIIVDNNRVTATVNGVILGDDSGDIAFRSAVSVDEGAGTYTRNTFQTINHDVLVRFNSNGPVVIGGSLANANTFLGGGVQYSDPNAAGAAVNISHNTFNGSVTGSVMRLQDNYHNAPVTVYNNTFTNLRWGISLENFRNVTVDSNSFTPLAGYTTFRHITVNTKTLASDTMGITPQQINGVFIDNTFNALGTVGGTAMAFYNHRVTPSNLGTFTVGTTGSPNIFANNFTWAIYLGDQSGQTIPAPVDFPEYDLGANSKTTMGCWYRDINIEKNTFNVGSGAQYPQFMNHAQRLALEAILWHLPDNSCLGELIYYVPVELTAKVFLQGPYDSTTGLMKDDLRTPTLLIPNAEPYTAINTAFPTSFTEVNNFVTESGVAGSVFAVTGSNAIVDWVWLELRDRTDSTIVLATRSALVQRDGDIVDLDGTSAVLFPDSYAGEYFVMVRHRNHLGTLTKTKINLAAAHFVDFTVATQPTVGTTATSARKLIKTATYGLIAGNTIPKIGGGYQVIYNNANNDRAPILNVVGASTPLNTVSNVYMLEDVNMDGKVRYNNAGNDRVIILNNVGASTPLNIVTQQPNF